MALLEIRVTPRASANRIELTTDGKLKVYVTAPPADGAANQAVIELLAKHLKVPKSSVQVIAGHTSRDKKVELSSLTEGELASRLSAKRR